MEGIWSFLGLGGTAHSTYKERPVTSKTEGVAAARFAPLDEYQGPSPFDTPPTGAREKDLCQKISLLADQDEPEVAELRSLLNEAEILFDYPDMVIEGFDRDVAVITLYNAIFHLLSRDPTTLLQNPKSQFLYDKLIKATYDCFLPNILSNPEENIPFYIQLFHQALTSPSFAFLYDKDAFFSQFVPDFFQPNVLAVVVPEDKRLVLDLLEKQLEYLALTSPSSEQAKRSVDNYLRTREREAPVSAKVSLAISILQGTYLDKPNIKYLTEKHLSYISSLKNNPKAVNILKHWIAQSTEEDFRLHHAIKQALETNVIKKENALTLQQHLLSKVIVRDSTVAIKHSLATIQEAAKSLENGLAIYSIPIATRFKNESQRLIKAISSIIHHYIFLDSAAQKFTHELFTHINQFHAHYVNIATTLAAQKASIRIDATHSQFTLPSINMAGRVTKAGQEQPGRGACLPIAAYTCNMLLHDQIQSGEDLKQAIYLGTSRHQAILKETGEPEGTHLHAENLEVFFPQLLREFDTGNALDKALQLTKGQEKRSYEAPLMLMDRLSDRQADRKLAAVIRIRGAFLSILFDKSKGSSAITIADSHGLHGGPAYAYTFSSIDDAAIFLSQAYPHIELDERGRGDPINNGEITYLTLPAKEEPIAEDRDYAVRAREATKQQPYIDPTRRAPIAPAAAMPPISRDPNYPLYQRVLEIMTGNGVNKEKLQMLGQELIPKKATLPQDLFKRQKNPGETDEAYQQFLVEYYTTVAIKHLQR